MQYEYHRSELYLNKAFYWFYFDGRIFRDISSIATHQTQDHHIVPLNSILGRVLFKAFMTRRGGHGELYLVTPMELLKLGSPEDIPSFARLFSPHILSKLTINLLQKMFRWRDFIRDKFILRYNLKGRIMWTPLLEEVFCEPLNYLARLIALYKQGKDPAGSVKSAIKMLHQIFTMFEVVKVLDARFLNTCINYVTIKQERAIGIPKLDAMMPITWDRPTVRVRNGNRTYSIWHEFAAPHPIDVGKAMSLLQQYKKGVNPNTPVCDIPLRPFPQLSKDATRRFDVVILRGDYVSKHSPYFNAFFPRPKYNYINSMPIGNFLRLPKWYYRFCIGRIDIIIECKEKPFPEWEHELREQVIPYFKKYRPNKMILVSAYKIPPSVVNRLGNRGIYVIAPFSPDTSLNILQQLEQLLRNIIECRIKPEHAAEFTTELMK